MELADIPALNALLNATATVLICLGYLAIRAGRREMHRACMVTALLTSCVFLVGYVAHKVLRAQGGADIHSHLGADGAVKVIYLVLLASHVLLAMVIVPLVLVTFRFAVRGELERHRRWARWTLPLWLYVSVTGVLVYLFLYRWFPASV